MPDLANLVRVVSTTTGTGTVTLGAAVQGFLTPTQAGMVDTNIYSYAIEADYIANIPTSREVGTGTYASGAQTLTRTVINSTNGNALLNLAGDEQVFITVISSDIREKLLAARTYYVRTDGNDSNSGLIDSAAGAFLTLNGAFTAIVNNVDFGGLAVTIQVRTGTYSAGILFFDWVGGGSLTIQGDTATPANIFIDQSTTGVTTAAAIFEFITPMSGQVTIKGFKLRTTSSGRCLISILSPGVNLVTDALELNGVPASTFTGALSITGPGAKWLLSSAGITISGSMPAWLVINGQSAVQAFNQTITLTGTPAFDWNGLFCSGGGVCISFASITFAGSATGNRYLITQNGIVDTGGGGASFLPGNAAGSTASQGQYL